MPQIAESAGNLDELLKDISPDLDPVLVDGVEEIKVMIKVDDGAELTCHFYNQVYNFSSNELQALIN